MSRTRKDRGWNHPYHAGDDKGHGKFRRLCRRLARREFKRALDRGEEPPRKSRWNYEYYD